MLEDLEVEILDFLVKINEIPYLFGHFRIGNFHVLNSGYHKYYEVFCRKYNKSPLIVTENKSFTNISNEFLDAYKIPKVLVHTLPEGFHTFLDVRDNCIRLGFGEHYAESLEPTIFYLKNPQFVTNCPNSPHAVKQFGMVETQCLQSFEYFTGNVESRNERYFYQICLVHKNFKNQFLGYRSNCVWVEITELLTMKYLDSRNICKVF